MMTPCNDGLRRGLCICGACMFTLATYCLDAARPQAPDDLPVPDEGVIVATVGLTGAPETEDVVRMREAVEAERWSSWVQYQNPDDPDS